MLITGATGTGKTYVACALAQQACRKVTVRSTVEPRGSSPSSRSPAPTEPTRALLAKIARADVLVIDDFAMTPITDAERTPD